MQMLKGTADPLAPSSTAIPHDLGALYLEPKLRIAALFNGRYLNKVWKA
jgi:hypothetical protein